MIAPDISNTVRTLDPDRIDQHYVNCLNSSLVNRFLECRYVTHTVESEQKYVQNIVDSTDTYIWGIHAPCLVGNIKLRIYPQFNEVSLVILEKNYWRKGLGAKALRTVLKHHAGVVRAGVLKDNIASLNLFYGLGFRAILCEEDIIIMELK